MLVKTKSVLHVVIFIYYCALKFLTQVLYSNAWKDMSATKINVDPFTVHFMCKAQVSAASDVDLDTSELTAVGIDKKRK